MESTVDLILKGHFESLKEKANSNSMEDKNEIFQLLQDTEYYLKQKEDEEAKDLLKRFEQLNQQNLTFRKKPMKKAMGKQKKSSGKRKAG